jgi:hypothetical protein
MLAGVAAYSADFLILQTAGHLLPDLQLVVVSVHAFHFALHLNQLQGPVTVPYFSLSLGTPPTMWGIAWRCKYTADD